MYNWKIPELQGPSEIEGTANPDCRGADWRGLKLGAANLGGAKLCRVDMRGTDLEHCNLEGADLRLVRYDKFTKWPQNFDFCSSGAVGPRAKLSGSFLNSADLSGLDLQGANLMGCYLSGADLSGSCLRGARLAGADLRHALLRGACLEGVRFSGCQLDYTDFRSASLEDADLSAADSIRGADFRGSTGLEPGRAQLLGRSIQELDCWNPRTQTTTRQSLGRSHI
ncbi:pentapeptide repeat-containing protein [Cyanobium sp. WAJ14-Wanaka]|uniref:pentapeptide repeat-containing protein n=1 Tax=Cyanobium sp. WAJ14-Wanaka TaxID=2823725 RepID=UPI0020CC8EB4|nr:pentapeptide repeat-containing protein [Cyanobium sp. WAJ14-Wanaka]MCP9775960.1 pentapeptide repeat-containing protein [Cyanobium sp. WAJ14-Wanaka]